ncbi:MAG: hypothetical protein IPP97_28825 [Candidatus Obscuribacter sp.]|nr:hypothetical protein [Candidatus Obscuribacter sp.]
MRKQIDEALEQSAETGLPLGTVLLSTGIISRTGLNSALSAQKLIRLEVAERDKIIYALKEARLRARSLLTTLQENKMNPLLLNKEFGVESYSFWQAPCPKAN